MEDVVVHVGPRGLRGRRTGIAPAMTVDVPGLADARALGEDALVAACDALVTDHPPRGVVVAVPEVAQTLDPQALLARVGARFGVPTVVVDARVATAAGAFGALQPCVVLDMGVGVDTLATDFVDVWHHVDGWGPLLGDRGSASWLGAQGLAAGLRMRDGVPGGSSELLEAGREEFGPEEGWPALFDRAGAATSLADFASTVGEVALRDSVAEGLCRLAGEHLADSLCAGAVLLPGAPVAATGGLLLVDAVKVALASAMGKRHMFLMPAVGDGLVGVHAIAEHLATGGRLPHRPPYVYTAERLGIGG